jgi:hypothetical protein
MNRIKLQQLAEDRINDATILLNAGQWSGAYYLAGYAVECALKACIAKLTNQHDFPSKDNVVKAHTHRVDVLADLAGLESNLKLKMTAEPAFYNSWFAVKDWSEAARYELWTEAKARALHDAIVNPISGVLTWIKGYW